MNWQAIYDSRRCSAAEAVGHVQSGHRVVIGSACGTPEDLIDALLERAGVLRDVELVAMASAGRGTYTRPEYAGSFRHNSFFVAPSTRKAVDEDRADYSPCNFGDLPGLLAGGLLPCDVAMVTVTPPDKTGFCSMGVSVSYDYTAAKSAKRVIAEVNRNMPFTLGESTLHVSEIDHFVSSDRPILELPRPEIGESEQAIAAQCATLIDDAACLQLGYGALPDALLSFLDQKNDLGIHTEMISDGVMQLVQKGVITCAKKSFKNRKLVLTVAMGSRALYEWMHLNPMIEMYPVEFTNDANVIGLNDHMVSINSALTVDLLGQAAADMMGARQYSGIGGQMEFIRGCRKSKGGKSILALAAASSDGSRSRIVAALEPGQAVSTPRNEIDYVVTEHGIAHLRGRTVKDRARMLIEVAAPQFREGLREDFRRIYGRDCGK